MIKYRIGFVIIILTLLVSCTSASSPAIELPTDNFTEEPEAEFSTTPSNATNTYPVTISTLPSQTEASSPSPTTSEINSTPTIPEESILYQCLEIVPDLPNDVNLIGVIIIRSYGPGGVGNTSFLNMENRTSRILPTDNSILLGYSVSPDRTWLAYKESSAIPSESKLIIMDADGLIDQTISWQNEWYTIVGWLDNERLLISKKPSDVIFGDLIILNPFTKIQVEVIPEFPNIIQPGMTIINWGEFSFSGMIFDPSLSFVLYPSNKPSSFDVVLWDVDNGLEVKSISTILARSPAPKWSPDGNKFAIARYYDREISDLFIIDLTGRSEQLTNFTSSDLANIGFYSWSPNSRYIAFWLQLKPSDYKGDRLILVDTITHKLTNFCIPGSVNGDTRSPIWSPDGQQLVVENYQGGNDRRVILIDIVNGYAAQIAEDVSPVGWMIAP